MRKLFAMLLCGGVLLAGVVASLTPADARRGGFHRGGGGHAIGHARAGRSINRNRNVNISRSRNVNINRSRNVNINRNRNITRNVARNVNRRYVYRNGRRGYWRNGLWVVAPAVAGATYVASCVYEYGRWQRTGSTYWRDRYYQCAN